MPQPGEVQRGEEVRADGAEQVRSRPVALSAYRPGDRLRVLATDPKAPGDFRLYSTESGHRLIEEGEHDGVFELVLERSA